MVPSASWIWIAVSLLVVIYFTTRKRTATEQDMEKIDSTVNQSPSEQVIRLSQKLASTFPNSTLLSTTETSRKGYWAKQQQEVKHACVVRPTSVDDLASVVKLIKHEYDTCAKELPEGLFAVRSGGHSPTTGAASIQAGILIDLSHFSEVIPSEDGSSVVIGTGARWHEVSKVLDEKDMVVVGGRASDVGVGGLTLGGGISYLTPRYGLVSSNILSYEIVTASGEIKTASATTNPDLWRALKGGSNNFGIVTHFTARCFPSTKIWGGFVYAPSFQSQAVLQNLIEYTNNLASTDSTTKLDDHAAAPLVCIGYAHIIRSQIIAVNLAYTKIPDHAPAWPQCYKPFSLPSLWRFWSKCKVRSLTNLLDDMVEINPPGYRRKFATTTIKNDLSTLLAAYTAHQDAIPILKSANVKGLLWTLVVQPFLPSWARLGDPSPLGLDHDHNTSPLLLVSVTVCWEDVRHDELITKMHKRFVETVDSYAAANKTGHPFKYLNYCAEWQRPLEGYGEENHGFLRGVSRKYDPDGLFQRGCVGGFKLGLKHGDDGYEKS